MTNILVCDDDKEIVEAIEIYLAQEGYNVIKAYDGEQAIRALKENDIQLLIIDIMMPKLDGIHATLKIREYSSIPIIILSAKSEDADKILGLNIGADDYVTKPFNPLELVARVKSCLRRASYAAEDAAGAREALLACRGLEVDRAGHVARLHGEDLALTPKEFDVLALLLAAGGRPVSTRDLYEAVWGECYLAASANSVMVHIRHLRAKLAEIDSDQVFIETVWGVGYKIAP